MASSSASAALGGASEPSSAATRNSPPKGKIFFTFVGSLSVSVPSRSPASITAPPALTCAMEPVSVAMSGITIFIASTSAKGLPATTSPPSSCR